MDYILNGQASGDVASRLLSANMDPRVLRPWVGRNGRTYIAQTVNGEEKAVVVNAPGALRREDWLTVDRAIVTAAKERLRVVQDLRSAGLIHNIPNGMSRTVLQTETQSDVNDAILSMDGMRASQNDRPEFDLENLPLPIVHKDFSFSLRNILASRNGGSPLDTTTAELAARRVAELVEKLTLGLTDPGSFAFAGGTIYGYSNHPDRNTKTITDPSSSGWTAVVTLGEILEMKTQSQDDFHFGPWMIYHSTAWDRYMDDDYSAAKGDNTLRQRIRMVEGIQDVRTVDFLSGFDLILVQMTTDTTRMVVGMDITTMQWESKGGMQLNFKVMAIMVPQLRSDFNGNMGLVHGSV